MTRPGGRIFVARAQVMDSDEVRRALVRIAHEIVERNRGPQDVAVIGLQTGGVPLGGAPGGDPREIEGTPVPFGTIDVAFYRDDIGLRPVLSEEVTDMPFDLTGRSSSSSTTSCSPGGPCGQRSTRSPTTGGRAVQLAVMVDRGHRELPIRPGLRRQEPADEARRARRRGHDRRLDR